jgi:hypothetical protein
MIRRVRYPVLALLVLAVPGIGVAADWSSPSRAPVPAIKLQAAPPEQIAASAPRITLKKAYGGRDLSRIPLPVVRRPAPELETQEPSPPVTSASGTESSEAPPRDRASTRGSAPDTSQSDDEPTPDRSPPRGPRPPAAPTPPTTSTSGANPAPTGLPAPAGEPTDDDDDDEDDDDEGDGGGGGDDDDGDDD